ncbi:MAG: RagB/SusD family nutrient uptake outer membrane protein [Muribaculaceae bacterium]|nr:RagB/SusD family nutrient uptake outer membrane protein [Muribaculaceae bacterium]
MKKTLIYGFLAVAFPLMTACSDSYLDLEPENQVTPETMFQKPSDAQYAINGIGRLMVSQYNGTQGLNGEGTMLLYYGEYPGSGTMKSDLTGWSSLINSTWNTNATSTNNVFPWSYCYRIIGNANLVISSIPDLDGMDESLKEEWGYIKAQALVYRAHSYLRLVQIYSRRWSDSNGTSRGVVLRLDRSTDPKPCSTLKEVYDQIYADLDEAITLFKNSSEKRSDTWLPSEEVAHAVYSRAALTREDWAKASSEAKLACAKSKLMTQAQYEAGFNTPNDEWIWCAYNSSQQDIYYYSFFSYCASNATSSSNRTYPLEISRQVVEKINPADTRLKLYAIPTADEMPVSLENVVGAGKALFTDEDDLKDLQDALAKETDPKKQAQLQGQIDNVEPINKFYNRIRTKGGFLNGRIVSNGTLYYYHATKFQNLSNPGVGQVLMYRMAEMLYNEAEAEFKLGNETAARAALEKATQPYQPDYTCTLSGDALYEEICNYRAFDLWGEGHSWYDMKRRGETLDRKGWTEGGNWNSVFAIEQTPTAANNWTKVIPQLETNYNEFVTAFE